MKCPKCSYERNAKDQHLDATICPQCGIFYHKWKTAKEKQKLINKRRINERLESNTWFSRLINHLLWVPEKVDIVSFWARTILYVVCFIWGWYFITAGIDWQKIGGSFLHNVILPFHEFGHVLFMPFGRFMSILGGSLFQLMLPFIVLIAFTFQHRNNFAASIMLWWAGQSFIDLSPYIADAPHRALPLILGMGEEAHDWGNILSMTGKLDKAATYAELCFGIGVMLILLSYLWGAVLLKKQKKNIRP